MIYTVSGNISLANRIDHGMFVQGSSCKSTHSTRTEEWSFITLQFSSRQIEEIKTAEMCIYRFICIIFPEAVGICMYRLICLICPSI